MEQLYSSRDDRMMALAGDCVCVRVRMCVCVCVAEHDTAINEFH